MPGKLLFPTSWLVFISSLTAVSDRKINPAPGTPAPVEAEVSKEISVFTLGIKDVIYIPQNKPILSFQTNLPGADGMDMFPQSLELSAPQIVWVQDFAGIGWWVFSLILRLAFSFSSQCILKSKFMLLMNSKLAFIIFDLCICVLSKKSLSTPSSQDFSTVFSQKFYSFRI